VLEAHALLQHPAHLHGKPLKDGRQYTWECRQGDVSSTQLSFNSIMERTLQSKFAEQSVFERHRKCGYTNELGEWAVLNACLSTKQHNLALGRAELDRIGQKMGLESATELRCLSHRAPAKGTADVSM